MQTYICLLRGINVSGHKMIKMDMLKNLFQKLGFKDVQTYIQSGNAVFRTDKTKPDALQKQIAKKINEDFGFEVPVTVITTEELKEVFTHNPFLNGRSEDIARLHVTFLSGIADKESMGKIKEYDYGKDEYIFAGNAIYLFCPDGYGNTKLNNNFFEGKLKLTATTRNWKTITELVRMAEEVKK